jgi:hypothetical protein
VGGVSTGEPFWAAFVDDAAMFPPGVAPLAEAVAAHLTRADALVGSFVARDTDLPEVRALVSDAGVRVSVVVTGGAGQLAGPAAYCRRSGLELAGLEVALRDLDDLVGNARRVVAAVDAARAEGALDEDVPVHVELPAQEPSYGWLAAADEVAGAELRMKFRTGGVEAHQVPPAPTLAAWIDAALDRETAFKCTAGLHHALRHDAGHGFLNVLLATVRAFDGAGSDEVVATLEDRAPALEPEELARGRRWFSSFGSCSVAAPRDDLRRLGLC